MNVIFVFTEITTEDIDIEDISLIQLDEATTMSWYNKGKIFR